VWAGRAAAEALRAELAQVRREAAEERAALRAEARQQLDAVLARFNTAPEQNEPAPAPSTSTGRRRGKPTTE
jgi:hypothetical protein